MTFGNHFRRARRANTGSVSGRNSKVCSVHDTVADSAKRVKHADSSANKSADAFAPEVKCGNNGTNTCLMALRGIVTSAFDTSSTQHCPRASSHATCSACVSSSNGRHTRKDGAPGTVPPHPKLDNPSAPHPRAKRRTKFSARSSA